MTIRIACDCGKSLQLRDDYAGKRVRCPACRAILSVPATAIAPAAKSAVGAKSKTKPSQTPDGPAPVPSSKKQAVRRRSIATRRRVLWPWFAAAGVAILSVILVVGGLAARRLLRPSAPQQSNLPEVASAADRRPQDELPRQGLVETPQSQPSSAKPPTPAPPPKADKPPAKPAPADKSPPPPAKSAPPPSDKRPPAPAPKPSADGPPAKPTPPPPANRPPAKPAQPATPPAAPLKTAAQVRALLAKEVQFTGPQKALVTLGDVLDMFTQQFGVKFVVDEAAFKEDGVVNVLQEDVSANWLLAPMNAQFDLILRKVLQRIPAATEAAFVVGPGTIRITTQVSLRQARNRAEPPPRPTAAMARRAKELKDRLAKRVDFSGVDDSRATLSDVLDLLAKRYDLTFDVNERAFKYEQLINVLRMPVCETQAIPAMKNVPLSKVLETILARIPVPSKADYRVTPQGCIEVSTKLFFKAGERARVAPPTS